MKKNVIIGFYGNTKDRSVKGGERWERWRPTLSLFEHEDFLVDRFEMLLNGPLDESAVRLVSDIRNISPETEIVEHILDLRDFWDFEEVYGGLHDFVKDYPWQTEQEDYLFHITTGSHVTQICTFLLAESRHFPRPGEASTAPAELAPPWQALHRHPYPRSRGSTTCASSSRSS